MLTQMYVETVSFDYPTLTPIVVLVSKDKKQVLPLWTDIPNAYSIISAVDKTIELRPMTHTLITSILNKLGCPFRVEIYTTVSTRELEDTVGSTATCPRCGSRQVSKMTECDAQGQGESYVCDKCGVGFTAERNNRIVYLANIVITKDKKEIKIDARPTDAIAIAIRVGADILVESDLLEKVDVGNVAGKEMSKEDIEQYLSTLSPADFEKMTKPDPKTKPN